MTGGGGGATVVGTDGVTRGDGGGVLGAVVVGAGLPIGAGRRGVVAVGEAAPFTWPAAATLVVAGRESDVRATATLVAPTATRAIKAKLIPSRFVMRGSFDWGCSIGAPHRRDAGSGL
jgi:hypothetical protein